MTDKSFDIRKYLAEAIGTFWLTFAGCGSAVLAAKFPETGIGFAGVALAFGLTVLTMAYAIGHVSGCHLNPAVTIGLTAGGRFPAEQAAQYIAAQVAGAIIGAAALYAIATGSRPSISRTGSPQTASASIHPENTACSRVSLPRRSSR